MNYRLIFLLVLLAAPFAEADTLIRLNSDLKGEQTTRVDSRASITKLVSGVTCQNHRPGQEQDPGTQISQSPDVAMQGSIVPACDVVLCLIAVLHPQTKERFPGVGDPSARQVLFKVLFQVIIAPNAP